MALNEQSISLKLRVEKCLAKIVLNRWRKPAFWNRKKNTAEPQLNPYNRDGPKWNKRQSKLICRVFSLLRMGQESWPAVDDCLFALSTCSARNHLLGSSQETWGGWALTARKLTRFTNHQQPTALAFKAKGDQLARAKLRGVFGVRYF